MNLLTIEGGLSVLTDEETVTYQKQIIKCGMCTDNHATVYHLLDKPGLHASGYFLTKLMPNLSRIDPN